MPKRNRDRDVLQTFAETITTCEACNHLTCCRWPPSLQIHHVLGGAHRIDAPWNLVRLCLHAHEWCHARPPAGRVLCWWLLHERGAFDPETIRERWGQCPLAYIERMLPEIAEDWCRGLGENLLNVY